MALAVTVFAACSSSSADEATPSSAAASTSTSATVVVDVNPTIASTMPTDGTRPDGGATTALPTTAVLPGAEPLPGATTTVAIPTTALLSPPVQLPEDWTSFDRSLARALVGSGAWSISVAVAKDGETVHTAAIGVADPGDDPDADPAKQPSTARPGDRYRLGSNSKILTAIVVMQLVQEGKLALDDAVTPRLATKLGMELTAPGMEAITVRELLGHTSGFNEYDRTFFGSRVDSCEEAAVRGLTNELDSAPGTAFLYSNMNYCLLGLLIEDVTGEDYEAVVQQRLLQPLGIDDMRMAGTLEVRKGDAHHLSGEARNYMEVLEAAGAWVGTAEDLVRILDSLDTAREGAHPLSEATVDQMLERPTVPYPFPNRYYGLGLRVWTDGSWGHTGTVENGRSMVLHRPDGLTWAVMVNGNAPRPTDDLKDLVNEAFAKVGIE